MKTKILFVLCLLVGLLFINAGLNKFFNYMPVPDDLPEQQINMFMAMMQVSWLLPLIGIAELIGGVLFIMPRFRALGALVLFPVLTGIVLAHFTVAQSGIPMALVIVAIWLWAVVENYGKFSVLISTKS